jgi:hypothetical protein
MTFNVTGCKTRFCTRDKTIKYIFVLFLYYKVLLSSFLFAKQACAGSAVTALNSETLCTWIRERVFKLSSVLSMRT